MATVLGPREEFTLSHFETEAKGKAENDLFDSVSTIPDRMYAGSKAMQILGLNCMFTHSFIEITISLI